MKVRVYEHTGDSPVRHGTLHPSDNPTHELLPLWEAFTFEDGLTAPPPGSIRVRIDRIMGTGVVGFEWIEYEGGADVLVPLEVEDD